MHSTLQTQQKSEPQSISETAELIDDAFYTKRMKWGTWVSYDANGKELVTSATEETLIDATRFYLKGLQEGWSNKNQKVYDSEVGGKL